MTDFRARMRAYITTEIETLQRLNLEEINEAINAVLAARERGGTVYLMGNGGSSATASHMASDFSKGLNELQSGKRFRAVCLSDNTPTMMAIANDFCYEEIFAYQLRNLLRPEDLVIAISGSGNSENVVRAATYAKEQGVAVVGITGYGGGRLKQIADYSMHVNIDDMQIAEDVHMMFDHMMMRVMSACLAECV